MPRKRQPAPAADPAPNVPVVTVPIEDAPAVAPVEVPDNTPIFEALNAALASVSITRPIELEDVAAVKALVLEALPAGCGVEAWHTIDALEIRVYRPGQTWPQRAAARRIAATSPGS